MNIISRTATQARNDFFQLINAAFYGNTVTVVKKNGKEVARIVPAEKEKFDRDENIKDILEMKGDMIDFPKDNSRKNMRKAWLRRAKKRDA